MICKHGYNAEFCMFCASEKKIRQQLAEEANAMQDLEQEIKEKGLTAPRVSKDDLENNIADIEIVKHVSKSGKVLRWAVITANNGYAIVGKPSAAVSVENDNQEIGEKVAIDNSKSEMWALMGYELSSKLAGQ